MTFQDLHTRAILPAAHVVCGIELLPLSVGHARILDALGLWNPQKPSELILVAAICSSPASAFAKSLQSIWFVRKLKLWAWRLGKKWDYASSKKSWVEYVTHHREEPAVTFKGKTGKAGMPFMAIVRAHLCSAMGYNPETFDDQPYAQVMIDYHAACELEGHCKVLPATVSEVNQWFGNRG